MLPSAALLLLLLLLFATLFSADCLASSCSLPKSSVG
jgi:hypothetical protein